MPALTRRRSGNPHQRTWLICYGDVHVGTVGRRAGVPVDRDQWGWACGFYPGLHPGQHKSGTAKTFEIARSAFEAAWRELQPNIPEGAFDEWRHDRQSELRYERARLRREAG